jgi:hypothetical protein
LDELDAKIKIIETRLDEIQEKTPKRSCNSKKNTSRRSVPNSIVVTSEDDPAVAINFDTPAAARTTPAATTSHVNEWLKQQEKNEKMRKQADTPEESIDLLAQKTPPEDEYDDDNDELFQKVL